MNWEEGIAKYLCREMNLAGIPAEAGIKIDNEVLESLYWRATIDSNASTLRTNSIVFQVKGIQVYVDKVKCSRPSLQPK